MRKTILTILAASLIAGSTVQLASAAEHHAHKWDRARAEANQQFRDANNFLPYAQVSSPMPIVRAEELELVRAQIQLGMNQLANAITMINHVHMKAGGFATPLTIAATYTAVRDSLLKEQRISTVMEASGDRMIALRMYHLESVADTTWQATSGPDGAVDATLVGAVDYHTTVVPVPVEEYTIRGGNYSPVCTP